MIRKAVYPMLIVAAVLFAGCAKQAKVVMDPGTVAPASAVMKKGTPLALSGTPLVVGEPLPATRLIESTTMKPVNLQEEQGQVLFLSIVPSIDTKVCEAQTHYLGEEGDRLPDSIQRITISRDTPFAHTRFAEAADLGDIRYLSDYQEGAFGRSTGLLVDGPMLLARSVILVDGEGIVRYIQVVPELTHLPDMERAFEKAMELAEDN